MGGETGKEEENEGEGGGEGEGEEKLNKSDVLS